MYLQKVISRKTFFKLVFVGILKVNDEKAGSGSRSGSISQRHGSAGPDSDPDPHQNVMDPQHCGFAVFLPRSLIDGFLKDACCEFQLNITVPFLSSANPPFTVPSCT
jgi:hypothetical protein